MGKKKIVIILCSVTILLLAIGIGLYFLLKDNKNDNIKFANEYGIEENNVFVYKTQEEILKILKNGTGIVYLGFPECPWCKAYVKYLNEVAQEEGIDVIYYYNILNDRKDNTKFYQEVVSILEEHLLYDNEGNRRIYVPDITFILNGKIIGHDNETSVIESDITPDEYWNKENVKKLKNKLSAYMKDINDASCSSCDL